MFTNSHAWCRSNQHPDAVVWNVVHSNLLSKARLLQWAYEILFCCGGRGVAEKCKENNYPPQTCCTKGTGVMRHINGSSSNILMKKNISHAPHNNLFHYLSLISLIWNKSLRLSTGSLLKGRREGWDRSLGNYMKRTGESYTTMLSVFPFVTCVYLLPLICCQRMLCKLLIITGHVVLNFNKYFSLGCIRIPMMIQTVPQARPCVRCESQIMKHLLLWQPGWPEIEQKIIKTLFKM